jgi:hypothetical protein
MIPSTGTRFERIEPRLCVSAPAKHLSNFRDVHHLVANFPTRKFLVRNTPAFAEVKQAPREVDPFALVHEQLLNDVVARFIG